MAADHLGTSVLLSTLLIGLSRWGLRLFTTDTTVIAEATRMMWYFVPYYALWSFIEIISNTLRGAGDAIAPTVISLIGVCLLRILWIAFVVPRWHTVMCISVSYPVTWFITALAFVIYYYKSNWLARCTGPARQGGKA